MIDDESHDWAWLDADKSSRFSPLESWPSVPACLPEDGLEPRHDISIDEVLEGTDSMCILRRIMAGDPLGLERILAKELDRLAVMFHPTRLLAATQARCAWAGACQPAPTSDTLVEWTCARMSEAMESLTQDDWSEERLGLPSDPMDDRYVLAQGPYGLTANQARRVALLFNQQAAKVRRPLYAVLVSGRPMTRVAEAFALDLAELKTLVYDCLASFRTTDAQTPVDLDDFGETDLDDFDAAHEEEDPSNPSIERRNDPEGDL
jgi:hypothetical protein